jgi:hypothetical protein
MSQLIILQTGVDDDGSEGEQIIWPAGLILARYIAGKYSGKKPMGRGHRGVAMMDTCKSEIGGTMRRETWQIGQGSGMAGLVVVELGAGAGVGAMTAAALGADAVATEHPLALSYLKSSLDLNRSALQQVLLGTPTDCCDD